MSFSLPVNKNLKYFFLADIISQFGSGMSFVGLNWFLLATTHLNAKVGVLMSISILSGLLILPFAGVITDHFNRKSILIYSNYIRAFFIFIVVIALNLFPFSVYYIYLLAVVNGIGWNLYLTSSRALIQEISTENLLKGNSLVEISLQVGMFTAGAAAGLVYKFFGFQAILIIDILTFIISNVFLAKIKNKGLLKSTVKETFTQQFIGGFKYLQNNLIILGFGIVILLPYVATVAVNVVLPGYISNSLKGDSLMFGFADMFYGIGASISGLVVMYLSAKCTKKYIVMPFFILAIASIIVLLVNKFFTLAFIAAILYGLPSSALRIMMNSMLMEVVPASFMGRAMSIWNFISTILQLIVVSTVGVFMDSFGSRFGFLYLLVIILIALTGYLFFSKRLLDSSGKLIVSSI